jgi:hypothetical protein
MWLLKTNWEWQYESQPKTPLQHLPIASTVLSTVYNGKSAQ